MASSAKMTGGKGQGKRRRYRGKMVLPNGSPRAHSHGGHSPAGAGYECGQTQTYDSKTIPGKFRVQMPPNRTRYSTPVLPIGK